MIIITLSVLVILIVLDYYYFKSKRLKVERSFLTLETKYGSVEYLDWGDPKDTPILISYGGGTGIDFIYSLDWLKEEGYRLIAVNRPGYYNLPIHVATSISEHADIYHSVVEHLKLESVHVFGVSMGGLSALYYAEKYNVKSLVLWCAISGPYSVNEEAVNSPLGRLVMSSKGKAIISWLMARSARLFPKQTIASFISTEAILDKKEVNAISKMVSRDKKERMRMIKFVESLAPMEKIYDGMMDEVRKSEFDDDVNWSAIQAPVLAVGSTVDKDVPIHHIERVRDRLNAQVLLVKNAGHFLWWGQESQKVIDSTLEFFHKES